MDNEKKRSLAKYPQEKLSGNKDQQIELPFEEKKSDEVDLGQTEGDVVVKNIE